MISKQYIFFRVSGVYLLYKREYDENTEVLKLFDHNSGKTQIQSFLNSFSEF